jgi:hypothetical protein
MLRALLAAGVVVTSGAVLWSLHSGSTPAHASVATSTSTSTSTPAPPTSTPRPAATVHAPDAPQSGAPAPAAHKLAPDSDAFRHRIDDLVPQRLYGEAARCYHGGQQRDQRLDLSYHVRAADGAVSFANVRAEDTTLTDRALERCILDRVERARWRDEQLPDYEGEGDVFMRVQGFKQYAE